MVKQEENNNSKYINKNLSNIIYYNYNKKSYYTTFWLKLLKN